MKTSSPKLGGLAKNVGEKKGGGLARRKWLWLAGGRGRKRWGGKARKLLKEGGVVQTKDWNRPKEGGKKFHRSTF